MLNFKGDFTRTIQNHYIISNLLNVDWPDFINHIQMKLPKYFAYDYNEDA